MTSQLTQTTLLSLTEASAEARSSDSMLLDETDRFSGADVLAAIEKVAAGYVHLGLKPGDRVAFLASSSAKHALAYLACQRIGAVPCALHLRDPAHRFSEAIDWLEASAVIVDDERESVVLDALSGRKQAMTVIGLGEPAHTPRDQSLTTFLGMPAPDGSVLPVRPGPEDLGMIILSSGTTGAPKGTLNLQRTLHATALAGTSVFGPITRDHSVLVAVAPSAAAWVHIVLPFLTNGAAVHFISKFEPRAFLERLLQERITHAPLVPTMWRMVLATVRTGDDLSYLEQVFFAGEVGDAELIAAFKAALPHAKVRTGYLSAEGGCGSACVADERLLVNERLASTTGQPVPGCELRLVEPDASVDDFVGPGSEGEIALRSSSVAHGYWKAPDLTARRFVNGWWRSGDLGRLDEEGNLFILGRTDNVINSGGLKVHAEEVEAALLQHPNVRLAGVVAESDARWGYVVVAHIVVDGDESEESIIQFCRDNDLLANFKIPKRVYLHAELPTGPTGKLNRRALSPP